MRLYAFIVSALFVACGDGAAIDAKPDSETASDVAEVSAEIEAADEADVAVDTMLPDVFAHDTGAVDTGPVDVFDPQPDAWTQSWTRELMGDATLLGLRYLGGTQGEAAAVIAIIDATGSAALVAGQTPDALPGVGRRLVVANLDATTGALTNSVTLTLGGDDVLGNITKAPNGFAVALAESRVILAQVFNGALRVANITLVGEGTIELPTSRDLARATTGGAATALALQLTGTGELAIGDATAADGEVALTLPMTTGVGFLTLPRPSAELAFPTEGAGLVVAADFVASDVVETSLGPVVSAVATADTMIRAREIAAGDDVLLIGALPDAVATDEAVTEPSVAVVLWQAPDPTFDLIQIASAGGGLVMAGTANGEVTLGEDTQQFSQQPFVGSLGSTGAFLYTGASCDEILSLTAGFTLRVMRTTCDFAGQGGALVMTIVGEDDGSGEESAPVDLLMVPFVGAAPAALSGLVSFNVDGGRAYGGLFDFGEGPRVVLVREDGQFYDSGVLGALAGAPPIAFQPLRQGGGGGGSNAATNAVLFGIPRAPEALPKAELPSAVIGRARLDFATYIR